MAGSARHERFLHTPRYLVRRRTTLDALRLMPAGSFLEAGCGRGELLPWLDELGFSGIGLEISEAVLPVARAAAQRLAPRVSVVDSLDTLEGRLFDYLFSFEVLEHLEDDDHWLAAWLEHLTSEGRLVLTVPAHMRLWTSADDAVGHLRRYERADILALLRRHDLEVEILWSFGYPLVLVTRPLRNLFYRVRIPSLRNRSAMDRTLESSKDSTIRVPRLVRGIARSGIELAAWLFYVLGKPLRRTDYGDGYLVVARRR